MISGIGSSSQLSSKLFSALDTKSQGYLEKSDFVDAFSKLSSSSSSSSSSASVDDVFSALDSDSDGKVTKDEFASTLAKLQEQFANSRMQAGGQGGPQGAGGPPPPPPASDAGFTKDELSSQLEKVGSSGASKGTDLLSKIVNNFEAADTNSDGKVSFTEAMAYDQSSQNSTASDVSSSGSADSASSTDAGIMMKIMQLMHAYGNGSEDKSNSLASLLSVSA